MSEVAKNRPTADSSTAFVDNTLLSRALQDLTNEELDQLEDELDFAIFAGLPSPRILTLLNEVVDLDSAWKALLDRQVAEAA